MSTICLYMIVKNESKTLPVLLNTVREIIDYYTKGLQLHILKDLQEIITIKLLQEKSLPNVSLHKSE